MGGEGAYLTLFFPVLLGVMALVLIAVIATDKGITRPRTLGLGRRRIAMGYLGAILVNALYLSALSYIEADSRGVSGVVIGWSLFLAVTSTPFVVAGLTVFVLPMLALLRRWNKGTWQWLVLATAIMVAVLSLLTLRFPDSFWCEQNPFGCVWRWTSNLLPEAIAPVVGFVLFARVPATQKACTAS